MLAQQSPRETFVVRRANYAYHALHTYFRKSHRAPWWRKAMESKETIIARSLNGLNESRALQSINFK